MQKYFMLTRGRTGSTAILDEFRNVAGVFSVQELFLRWPDGRVPADVMRDFYRFVLPFDVWKNGPADEAEIGVVESAADRENAAANRIQRLLSLMRRIPLARARKYVDGYLEGKLHAAYLSYAERMALQGGGSGLIFKVLSNNLTERKGLTGVLKDSGYCVLYLVRSNLVCQVLSGLIARKRGVYNRRNYAGDSSTHSIDVDEFEMLVKVERMRVDEDRAMLKDMAFDFLEVSYEEFCENRERFYRRIFEFMDLPFELPRKTDYSIMTDDLRKLIVNYDQLEARVARMGLAGVLDEDHRATSKLI